MAIPVFAGYEIIKEGSLSDGFNTLLGRAKFEVEDREIPLVIKPIKIGRGDLIVQLSPKFHEKAIGFELAK